MHCTYPVPVGPSSLIRARNSHWRRLGLCILGVRTGGAHGVQLATRRYRRVGRRLWAVAAATQVIGPTATPLTAAATAAHTVGGRGDSCDFVEEIAFTSVTLLPISSSK